MTKKQIEDERGGNELLHLGAVHHVIEQVVLGETLDNALQATAKKFRKSPDTVKELYRANVRNTIYEVVKQMCLRKKISSEVAAARVEKIIGDLDKRQSAQPKAPKRRKTRHAK